MERELREVLERRIGVDSKKLNEISFYKKVVEEEDLLLETINQFKKDTFPLSINDIGYLKELQKELLIQPNVSTAQPLFWHIVDYKKVPAYVRAGDSHEFYSSEFPETSFYSLEEVLDHFKDSDLLDNISIYDFKELEDLAKNNDIKEFLRLIEKYTAISFEYVDVEEVMYPVMSRMFITKKEAEEYLARRSYAYSKKAHVYADCALYSDGYESLLKLFLSLDLDNLK